MARKNPFDKYMEIGTDPARILTEAEIMRGLRGYLHRLDWTKECDDITKRQRRTLLLNVYGENPRRITPEHTRKGLEWFATMRKHDASYPAWTPNSPRVYLWRDTQLTRHFPPFARDIVERFDHFLFCGLQDIGNAYRSFYVPVYEVVARDGSSFRYSGRSWQSGGGWDVEAWESAREAVAA